MQPVILNFDPGGKVLTLEGLVTVVWERLASEILGSYIQGSFIKNFNGTFNFDFFFRPMPNIAWLRNGQYISSSSKYSFDQYKKRFTINNPVKADEGDYQCDVSSGSSPSSRTSTAKLTINGN